jgi:hypothetical protein
MTLVIRPPVYQFVILVWSAKPAESRGMKYWEITDNLSKAGWSSGYVSPVDREGRPIWIADAHRDDGKRFVVRRDEKLTALIELEAGAVRPFRRYFYTRARGGTSQALGNHHAAEHKQCPIDLGLIDDAITGRPNGAERRQRMNF